MSTHSRGMCYGLLVPLYNILQKKPPREQFVIRKLRIFTRFSILIVQIAAEKRAIIINSNTVFR